MSSAVRVVTRFDLGVVLTHSRRDNRDLVDVALDVVDPRHVHGTKLRDTGSTDGDRVLFLLGVVVVLLLRLESGNECGLQGDFSVVQPACSAQGVGIQLNVELDVFGLELISMD